MTYKHIYENRTVWRNQADELHRVDGPAIEWHDGYKEWYLHGKIHRLDGPAIENSNGTKSWYYEGEFINCNSQQEFKRLIKLRTFL